MHELARRRQEGECDHEHGGESAAEEAAHAQSLLPKMEIEVVVTDSMAADAIKAIIEAARTGEIGDGRVFVLPVLESYKIRTGEREV